MNMGEANITEDLKAMIDYFYNRVWGLSYAEMFNDRLADSHGAFIEAFAHYARIDQDLSNDVINWHFNSLSREEKP